MKRKQGWLHADKNAYTKILHEDKMHTQFSIAEYHQLNTDYYNYISDNYYNKLSPTTSYDSTKRECVSLTNISNCIIHKYLLY